MESLEKGNVRKRSRDLERKNKSKTKINSLNFSIGMLSGEKDILGDKRNTCGSEEQENCYKTSRNKRQFVSFDFVISIYKLLNRTPNVSSVSITTSRTTNFTTKWHTPLRY